MYIVYVIKLYVYDIIGTYNIYMIYSTILSVFLYILYNFCTFFGTLLYVYRPFKSCTFCTLSLFSCIFCTLQSILKSSHAEPIYDPTYLYIYVFQGQNFNLIYVGLLLLFISRIRLQLPPGKLQVAFWRQNINFDVKIEILALIKNVYRYVGSYVGLLLL